MCGCIYTVTPVIDTITPSIRTVNGRSVSLYCYATGEEPPWITWQFSNGTVISNSDRGSSSLTLECVATNSIGSVSRITTITTVGK